MTRARRSEDGIYLVMWALLMTGIFAMVAIVIDLAALRNDRRADSSAADFAVTAGALKLDPGFGGSAGAACTAAWEYFLANRPDASPVVSAPPCTGAGSPFSTVCVAGAARNVIGLAGAYTVTIYNPVTDAQLNAEFGRGAPAYSSTNDGTDGCKRLGVVIRRNRPYLFGRSVGIGSGTSVARAVARTAEGKDGVPSALLLLDQTGCEALHTSGQGAILVDWTQNAAGDKQYPGIIAVDSNGRASGNPIPGCGNNNSHVIEADNNSNNTIQAADVPGPGGAQGSIWSYALSPNGAAAKAYDPADTAGLNPRLQPVPIPLNDRITRAPVDHKYNCKVTNGCTDPPNPYIDNLVASLTGTGAPAGWSTYPNQVLGASCSMPVSTPDITVPSGKWWVNCPGGLSVSNNLTFQGGQVLTEGDVSVGGQGTLVINQAGGSGLLYMRNNSGTGTSNLIKGAQGKLTMPGVFVYQEQGRIDIGAGSGGLTWTAPTAGNFKDLALWTEYAPSGSTDNLGGQASLNLQGTLFLPNAQFVFTGQPGFNQTNAQFIAARLEVGGQGVLKMKPDPDRVVKIPLLGVRLIR
ncbi:MAG TPA: hypothetical protein VFJ85_18090 [Acidimicrobiales bacterium]|nr:hypothetical protein [Acidimicrobiales bacterium]